MITWPRLCVVWAQVQPVGGREVLEGKQMEDDRSANIRIRYRADVTASMRVRWAGRTFDIMGVLHTNESGRETELQCRELLNEVIADG